MRKLLILAITLMFAVGWNQILFAGEKEHGGDLLLAGEHGGKEHGGKEHGGTAAKKVSSEQIRAAMKNHVLSNYVDGTFQIKDPKAGKIRKLKLLKVHERVGKTGDYHYSCADFKDTETGELLDLDLDIDNKGGVLSVVDVRIHKDNGIERYTYDENDNMISLEKKEVKKEHAGKEHGGKEHSKEHGGKEHGGK